MSGNLRRTLGVSLLRGLLVMLVDAGALGGCSTPPPPEPKTIAQTVASNPQLRMWSLLMDTSGLNEMLEQAGPYTLFAPSDDAFKALSPEMISALGKDPEFLKSVLSYHVVPGTMKWANAQTGRVATVQGSTILLQKSSMVLIANEAVIITSDLTATNGVIHIVDKVLVPR